ncbi:MAG TPA: hypothetical protein VLH09_00595 [Bryobacteraceae bacterium]|nr:hypothetical protein [Bryobacteraceae bacterium]
MARRWTVFGAVLAGLALSRLCHVRVLWADADYHLAAALQILQGRIPYRDFWFDKPPLTPLLYTLIGARPGVVLALAGACYLFLACVLVYQIAKRMWGEREGMLAAGLLAFYLVFYLPAAVIPVAVDLAMLVPHLAAIACLLAGMPLAAGAIAGAGFLINVKALLVLAVCLLWRPRWWLRLSCGFMLVVALSAGGLAAVGALGGYWEQVWKWGASYTGSSHVARPYLNGLVRTVNWLAFHAAVAAAALVFFIRDRGERRREVWIWLVVSFAAVCLGLRFMPRYYLQLLPVLAVAGARGVLLALESRRRITAIAAGLLLLVPLVRFGPRYFMLASDLVAGRPHRWGDIALDDDSHAVARILRQQAQPGDTLLVWGYRPGIYVYARMPAGSRFLDSQPLTGVPAERHFYSSQPVTPEWARANRDELIRSSPAFVVDALGMLNPQLAIDRFADLKPWLAQYRLAGRTPLSLIYQRLPSPDATGVLAHHRLPGGAAKGLLKFGHVGDDAVHAVLAR